MSNDVSPPPAEVFEPRRDDSGSGWANAQQEALDGLSGQTQKQLSNQRQIQNGEKPSKITGQFGKAVIVDNVEMEMAVRALHDASEAFITDKDTIFTILKNKTEAERHAMDEIHCRLYGGRDLETQIKVSLSDADLDRALNSLWRKDGSSGDAERIQTALVERSQLIFGRSDDNCEKDIRDTIATMSSGQIEKLMDDYQKLAERKNDGQTKEERARAGKRYYEPDLATALLKDNNLSQKSRQAIEIYLKGSDKIATQDTLQLAEIALKAKDVEMFEETFRSASPEARSKFKENDGEGQMKRAFAEARERNLETEYRETPELRRAREYAEYGKLLVATKISENSHWHGDNEQAITAAIAQMTKEERDSYLVGRKLAAGETVAELSEENKQKALQTYRSTHDALADAGNETEVAQWEDQIAKKGGTIITSLLKHRGSIYDDDVNDVCKTLEGMNREDWTRLKFDPSYRTEIQSALKTFLSDSEVNRVMAIVDEKSHADSYEASVSSGRRTILQIIQDSSGTLNDDEASIFDGLQKMSPEDINDYRTKQEYRDQVDAAIRSTLDAGPEQDAAFALLKQALDGKQPTLDIVTRINLEAAHVDVDEGKVIRDLQRALRPPDFSKLTEPQKQEYARGQELYEQGRHPIDKELSKEDRRALELYRKFHVRDMVTDPQNQEDIRFATELDTALHRALDEDEYNDYARPILEDGHLPLEVMLKLDKGIVDDNEQDAYKDIVTLARGTDQESVRERSWLLADPAAQKKVLGFLSDDERQIALYALKQGEMRPEDIFRSHVVGFGADKEEIKQLLSRLDPEQIKQLRRDYATKYGQDLDSRLLDEVSGKYATEVKRLVQNQPADAREAYNDFRNDYYVSYDGVGKRFVNGVGWDGTGYMSESALNDLAHAITVNPDLTAAQRAELNENLQKNLELYRESKGQVADAVVDAVIIAGSLLAAKYTGGASLKLIAFTTLGGGLFKTGTKAVIVGADYDSSQTIADFASGAVDTAAIFLGPAHLGRALKLGENAAVRAAGEVIAQDGGWMLSKAGKDILEPETKKLVASAIAHGQEEVDEKAIAALAKKVAAGESEVGEVADKIKESLRKAFEVEARSEFKRLATEAAFNTGTGVIVGGASGGVRGVAAWDGAKTVEENLQNIAASAGSGAAVGGLTAGILTVGGKAIGKGLEGIRGADKGEAPHGLPPADASSGSQAPAGHSPERSSTNSGSGNEAPAARPTTDGSAGEVVQASRRPEVADIPAAKVLDKWDVRDLGDPEILSRRQITRTPKGQIASTKNVYGEVTKFEYSTELQGSPVRVEFPDGSIASKQSLSFGNDVWLVEAPGKPSSKWHGRMAVQPDGTLVKLPVGGGGETIFLNGLREIAVGDGKGTMLIQDARGRTLKTGNVVESKTTAFEYDGGDAPVRVLEYDGDTKTQKLIDIASGRTVVRDQEGRLIQDLNASHAETNSTYPDGSTRRYSDDGKLLKISHEAGRTTEYEWTSDGVIKSIRDRGGKERWTSEDGYHWTYESDSGQPPATFTAKAELEPDGTFKFEELPRGTEARSSASESSAGTANGQTRAVSGDSGLSRGAVEKPDSPVSKPPADSDQPTKPQIHEVRGSEQAELDPRENVRGALEDVLKLGQQEEFQVPDLLGGRSSPVNQLARQEDLLKIVDTMLGDTSKSSTWGDDFASGGHRYVDPHYGLSLNWGGTVMLISEVIDGKPYLRVAAVGPATKDYGVFVQQANALLKERGLLDPLFDDEIADIVSH